MNELANIMLLLLNDFSYVKIHNLCLWRSRRIS